MYILAHDRQNPSHLQNNTTQPNALAIDKKPYRGLKKRFPENFFVKCLKSYFISD